MIDINLRDTLQEGQQYVAKFSEELGIEVVVAKHKISTDTCFEKADILGPEWTPDRVIKALFFGTNGNLYGLVFPELGTREKNLSVKKADLARLLGINTKRQMKEQMQGFHNSMYPEGMERGTCTPFVLKDAFKYDGYTTPLEKIFIHDIPKLDKEIVDISIGGDGDNAHKTSLHLPYSGIYDILYNQFGDRIEKRKIF